MNKLGNQKITSNEVMCILIGIMLDVSVAGLPNNVTNFAKQDGWISVAIGAIYTLYVALIAIYIIKKHPTENILFLSRKYLGNIFGTILNIIFILIILSYYPALISLITIILKTYVSPSLNSLEIYMYIIIIAAIVASKGLKVIGKVCNVSFYIVLVILLISAFVFKEGSLLNISPVLGVDFKNILRGSVESRYDYALIESVFLIYPFIEDKGNTKKAILKTVFYITLIYVWITFITIYYMGSDIISKTSWAFFSVTEAINLEIINNFRYIFIFFWIIIALKSASIINYLGVFGISEILKKKSSMIISVIIGIIVIFLANNYYTDTLSRNLIIGVTSKYGCIFNCIYLSIIAILIFKKRDEKNEEIKQK